MTPEAKAAADKLCRTAPHDAGNFAHCIQQNTANWEELRKQDPAEFRRRLLYAYRVRIEAEEEPSSVFKAERLAFVYRLMPAEKYR